MSAQETLAVFTTQEFRVLQSPEVHESDVSLSGLSKSQILDDVRTAHYQWFQAGENGDQMQKTQLVKVAEAGLHELGSRATRGTHSHYVEMKPPAETS